MRTIPEGWHIKHNPKLISMSHNDWDYWHDDDEEVYTTSSYYEALNLVNEFEYCRLKKQANTSGNAND